MTLTDPAFIRRLEAASPLGRLAIALRSAWHWKRHTGMSFAHMLGVPAEDLPTFREWSDAIAIAATVTADSAVQIM